MPTRVPGLSGHHPTLSPDELTVYFSRDRKDIYMATRADRSAPFGTPVAVAELNTTQYDEEDPTITADGLTIYFGRRTQGIFRATRATKSARFGAPVRVLVSDTNVVRWGPFVSSDGATLLFTREGGGADLFTTVATGGEAPLSSVNSTRYERSPVLSSDGLTLVFASDRESSTSLRWEFWEARRRSTTEPFAKPVKLSELTGLTAWVPAWLSPDGCVLYMNHLGFSSPQTSIAVRPSP